MGQADDELPAELRRRESRLQKIAEAKAALEEEAKQKAAERKAAAEAKIAERREQEARTGKKPRGRDPQVPDPEQAVPEKTAQRNFTDAESRIMPDGAHKGSFVQAYNTQAAVDGPFPISIGPICYLAPDKDGTMLRQLRIPLLITLLAPYLFAEWPTAALQASLRQARQKLQAAKRAVVEPAGGHAGRPADPSRGGH
jgi:hypothetical protein